MHTKSMILSNVTGFWKTYHLHTSEIISLPPYNTTLQANQKYVQNYSGN